MDLNIKKAYNFIQNHLNKEWGDIDFDYSISKDEVNVTADLELNNHGNVYAEMIVYQGGGTWFRAFFGEIEKTPEVLELLNEFNYNEPFFKAFIGDGGFELRHFFVCFEEDMLKSYAGEFLTRLAGLADDECLKKLTRRIRD